MAIIPQLPTANYIDSDEALIELVANLQSETLLAIDTESNNMYVYQGRICLIQLSTANADYIIDPLEIENMQPLGDLLANTSIEKIFHAAEYDIICFKRDFGFEVRNIFDTMFAARFCKAPHFGLADMLLEYFDIKVDKRHQRDDWGKRPLPIDSLQYAQMDTHFLHELRDRLRGKLIELGQLDEAYEVFSDVLLIEAKEQIFDPNGFWKLGRPNSLTRRQMAILRELYLLRDEIALEQDRPHFKVIANSTLITLTRKKPHTYRELSQIRGLNHHISHTYGKQILAAIQAGNSNRLPKRPPRGGPSPRVAERYTILHVWRRDRAEERDLDSSLIISKHALWELAHIMPQNEGELLAVAGIGEWRLKTYGDELLKLIKTMR